MTDTQLTSISNVLSIEYRDNNLNNRTLNIKYINPDATNEQLYTFATMLHGTFMDAAFVKATRTVKGTLEELEG